MEQDLNKLQDKFYNNFKNLIDKNTDLNKKLLDCLKESQKNFTDYLKPLLHSQLKDKYVLHFKGSEMYIYPKKGIKENFIIKIEFKKEETSSTPNEFLSFRMVLNTIYHQDLNLLATIGNISQICSNNYLDILSQINKSLNNFKIQFLKIEEKKIKLHKEYDSKLENLKSLLYKEIPKALHKQPLNFSSFDGKEYVALLINFHKIHYAKQIELINLSPIEGYYEVLVSSTNKKDGKDKTVKEIFKFKDLKDLVDTLDFSKYKIIFPE